MKLYNKTIHKHLIIYIILFNLLIHNSSSTNKSTILIKTKQAIPYQLNKIWFYPMLQTKGFRQKGIASWYGKNFHGKKTSNDEKYNMNTLTAAHKTIPFNTWVRVYNISKNKQIDVRINDRGPFVKNRIIDLSFAAAKKLELVDQGTTIIELIILGQKNPINKFSYIHKIHKKNSFSLQAGAFTKLNFAKNLKTKLTKKINKSKVSISSSKKNGITFYRVRIGKFDNLETTINYKKLLSRNGFSNVIIILN